MGALTIRTALVHSVVNTHCTHDQVAARRKVGLAVAGLAVVTVAAARLGIRCPVKTVFGIDCPGCGGTRALAALVRGDIQQAAHENVAALVAGLVTAGYFIAPGPVGQVAAAARTAGARYRGTRWLADHPQAAACLATALWGVARNCRRPTPVAQPGSEGKPSARTWS